MTATGHFSVPLAEWPKQMHTAGVLLWGVCWLRRDTKVVQYSLSRNYSSQVVSAPWPQAASSVALCCCQ
jgi:hypothetical protein